MDADNMNQLGDARRRGVARKALPDEGAPVRLTRADVERMLAAAPANAVDLRGADLRHADLSGLHLSGMNLHGARLDGASLEDTDLRAADLGGAHLPGARMTRTDLTEAQLEHAYLEGADLRGATLIEAHLDHADLSGAHLEKAALQGAHLRAAHLAHARLDGAHLRGAHLDEATLWGATLYGAELEGGHFSGADFHDADLNGAFFAGCILADADLALARWKTLRAGEEVVAAQVPVAERPEQYQAAADAYRRLRQACAAQGLYDRAGDLYRREMRMRQAALACETLWALWTMPALGSVARLVAATYQLSTRLYGRAMRPVAAPLRRMAAIVRRVSALARAFTEALARLVRPGVRWAWHVILEVLCGYGERVGRVIVVGGAVMLGMALVYLRLGQLTEVDGRTVTSFWHALYFSACSFSSIGYAAFAPNAHGLAKWLGVAESFTGNFLLALFLVTFTRKLTR